MCVNNAQEAEGPAYKTLIKHSAFVFQSHVFFFFSFVTGIKKKTQRVLKLIKCLSVYSRMFTLTQSEKF